MANGEHEQDLGKTYGEPSGTSPREIPDYGGILRRVLENLGPIDPPVFRRGDHLGSRGRPDMYIDWAIIDAKDQLPPHTVKVEPSMVTDPGDDQERLDYIKLKAAEMRDSGCIESKGCDEVTIQHIPSIGPGSRSYGIVGRGLPYLDTPGYEEIPGQSIEQPNSMDIDDKES